LPCSCVIGRTSPTLASSLLTRSGAHRDLHSFPTRRSSDLRRLRRGGRRSQIGGQSDHRADALVTAEAQAFGCRPAHVPGQDNQRSEEHTSELQSHLNLVCRLLLEKKKKQKNKKTDADAASS